MPRRRWVLVIANVLVSSILLEVQVFAEGERKKIVMVDQNLALLQRQQQFNLLQQVLTNPVNRILYRINVVHTLSFIYALAIELRPDGTLAEALAGLQNLLNIAGISAEIDDDLVVSVNPIIPALSGDLPSTEKYDWGLTHIRVDVAHNEMPTLTGAGVEVAVLDTGVGPHTDLTIVGGFNALSGGGSYNDGHGHGTHIAGIIAAKMNNLVIKGAAPEASIIAVKVLDDSGKGHLSDLISGLQWVYNNPQIPLVNMSLGFSTDSTPLRTAIQKLFSDNGTIMVASAGNKCSDNGDSSEDGGDEGEGPTCDTPQTDEIKYPAGYAWVLAVTAIDINYQITTYSLTKAGKVDLTAPGGVQTGARILSTCPLVRCLSGYGYRSGTSQAAAHITGALALKLQQEQDQDSQITLSEVRVLLQQDATKKLVGQPQDQGWGLIDVPCLLDPITNQCPPP